MRIPVEHVVELLSSNVDELAVLVGDINNPENAERVKVLAELVRQSHELFSKEIAAAADRAMLKVLVKTFLIVE